MQYAAENAVAVQIALTRWPAGGRSLQGQQSSHWFLAASPFSHST